MKPVSGPHQHRLPPQRSARILAIPIGLAVLSLIGLVLGLTGLGWRDLLSAILIALPLAALARAFWHRN